MESVPAEGGIFYNGKTAIDFTEKICSAVGLFVEAGFVFIYINTR